MKTLVIYHMDADGFCSAFVAWMFYKGKRSVLGDIDFMPIQYGTPLPEEASTYDKVYVLDFSFPRHVIEDLATKTNVVVLDHHKTAEEDLRGLPYAFFDQNKSGAVMAYDYFLEQGMPANFDLRVLCEYVQDRDLWRFKLVDSKEINSYIATWEHEFTVWEENMSSVRTLGPRVGRGILVMQDRQIECVIKHAISKQVGSKTVCVVNSPLFQSEVGDRLGENADIVIIWFQEENNGHFVCSLRSPPNGLDVGRFAKTMGGGGHKHAAGFVSPTPPLDNSQLWSALEQVE